MAMAHSLLSTGGGAAAMAACGSPANFLSPIVSEAAMVEHLKRVASPCQIARASSGSSRRLTSSNHCFQKAVCSKVKCAAATEASSERAVAQGRKHGGPLMICAEAMVNERGFTDAEEHVEGCPDFSERQPAGYFRGKRSTAIRVRGQEIRANGGQQQQQQVDGKSWRRSENAERKGGGGREGERRSVLGQSRDTGTATYAGDLASKKHSWERSLDLEQVQVPRRNSDIETPTFGPRNSRIMHNKGLVDKGSAEAVRLGILESQEKPEEAPEKLPRLGSRQLLQLIGFIRNLPDGSDLKVVMEQRCQKLGAMDLATIISRQQDWQKALEIFQWMQQNGMERENMDALANVFRILGDAEQWGVVDSILEQVESSSQLPSDSVYEVVILGQVRAKQVDLALTTFDRMVGLGVMPGVKAFTTLMTGLQKSQDTGEASLKVVASAERVLVQMNTQGIKFTPPYNSMLNMYLKAGLHDKALRLLREMEELNVPMDIFTFHAALRTFGLTGNVDAASELFQWITRRHEYDASVTVITYTIMVGIYGAAQRMEEAVGLLHEMNARGVRPDIALYNNLLRSLGSELMLDDVTQLYGELKESGPPPNLRTYANLVMTFGRGQRMETVASVLADMRSAGVMPDQAFIDAVLRACSCSIDQWAAVDQTLMDLRAMGWQPSAWQLRGLMQGYHKQHPMPKEMLQIAKELHEANIALDDITWRSIIAYHFYRKDLEGVETALAAMKADGNRPSKGTLNMVMDLYGHLGKVEEAEAVFLEMKERGFELDSVCYNTMMNAYKQVGRGAEVELLLQTMQTAGIQPTARTWTLLLKAFQKAGEADKAMEAYRTMQDTGIVLDEIAYNTVINACGKLLPLEETLHVYRAMQAEGFQPNMVTHNLVLSLLIKNEFTSEAEVLFKRLKAEGSMDAVSCSTMVNMYGKARELSRMEELVEEVRGDGMKLSVSVYNAMIDAYGKAQEYGSMEKAVLRMKEDGLQPDLFSFNSMIHAYGMGNMAAEMENVLERQKQAGLRRDIWTYNILIGVYGELQMPFASVRVFRDMQDAGLSPDRITFCNLISAFRRSGDYLEAARWSLWMKQAGFQPSSEGSDSEAEEEERYHMWT